MQHFGQFSQDGLQFENRITKLLGIKYPIIQAGMIWASGWRLASAVSNAGGLGIIGAGSMYPETLDEHLTKCKLATQKPFGVNLPLLYPDIEKHIELIIKHKIPIVITSAGSPKLWTKKLQDEGILVMHVVSSAALAVKCEQAGVNAVIAEGFEAGGHNGREETTTLSLIPSVRNAISIPLIAAGGIATGNAVLATMMLGAEAAQIGTRFVCSEEASSHINFKNAIINTNEGDTELVMKKLIPVRLLKNEFYQEIKEAEQRGATNEEIMKILGRGKAKMGMFEGEMKEGELEIGQISAILNDILPASEIVQSIWNEFNTTFKTILGTNKHIL
jgi:enoyl-[acyl-carrier protein] reductase II